MCHSYNLAPIGKIKKLVIPCPNSHVWAALPDSDSILPDIDTINPVDFCRVKEVHDTWHEEEQERQDDDWEEKYERVLEAEPQDDTDC